MPRSTPTSRLYTLEVLLISGLATEEFAKANPVVSRTIEMRGNQSLAALHETIFLVFDRYDEHMYEFQFGKEPMADGPRYGFPDEDLPLFALFQDENKTVDAAKTKIDALDLKPGQVFWYWFDFGDDWWHQITVTSIEEKKPEGKYPKVTERVGESPPQYIDDEDEEEWDDEEDEPGE